MEAKYAVARSSNHWIVNNQVNKVWKHIWETQQGVVADTSKAAVKAARRWTGDASSMVTRRDLYTLFVNTASPESIENTESARPMCLKQALIRNTRGFVQTRLPKYFGKRTYRVENDLCDAMWSGGTQAVLDLQNATYSELFLNENYAKRNHAEF